MYYEIEFSGYFRSSITVEAKNEDEANEKFNEILDKMTVSEFIRFDVNDQDIRRI